MNSSTLSSLDHNQPSWQSRLNFELILYCLAFILALALRFWNLASPPLSDSEATWALQALRIANGERFVLGANPGYMLLTSALFRFFGPGDGLSRTLPALSGSLLVLAPFLLSRAFSPLRIQRFAALLMAFGLAFDPGLVVSSRLAGGPMPALSFTVLAVSLWISGYSLWAGIAAGLALLSGVAVVPLLISLVITGFLVRYLVQRFHLTDPLEPGHELMQNLTGISTAHIKQALLALGLTTLLVGTLFLRYPLGMAAWAQQIPAYLAGWNSHNLNSTPVPVLRGLAAVAFYQPLALILAAISTLRCLINRSKQRTISLSFIIWLALSVILYAFYPARQALDLTPVLFALWGLAALELSHLWSSRPVHPISWAQAAITLTLLGLLWFNMAAMTKLAADPNEVFVRGAILVGILALIGLTATLVLLGWNWAISRNGLLLGAGTALCLYAISTLWGAAYLRFNQPQELWFPTPGTGQVRLFVQTLNDVTEWQTSGYPQTLDLVVTVKSPSLQWALRNYRQAQYLSHLDPNSQPAVVITSADQSLPSLSGSYRGQDFVWAVQPGWQTAIPTAYINWFTFREATLTQEKIILWVRSDLFKSSSVENK